MTLEREILEVLSDLDGRLTPTAAIYSHTRLATGQTVSLGDVIEKLGKLEKKGQVASTNHEDYGLRWQITGAGKVRLRD